LAIEDSDSLRIGANTGDVFLSQNPEGNFYKRLARLIRNSLEWTSEKDLDIIKEAAAGT